MATIISRAVIAVSRCWYQKFSRAFTAKSRLNNFICRGLHAIRYHGFPYTVGLPSKHYVYTPVASCNGLANRGLITRPDGFY